MRSDVPVWTADQQFDVVGRPLSRVEGIEKVTGRARYAYDQRLPRQLYARVLRSPHPHARIRRIDTAAAEALPGVHAVLSSAKCPAVHWYEEKALLFDPTVRMQGDEVAAVAAESEEIAEDAIRLIHVEYEQLPFVPDLDAARVGSQPDLAGEPERYQRGDVESGFAEADIVIDQTYVTQTALHNCLEPHGCTASWEGEQLTIWESTQSVFDVRSELAAALGVPEHRLRVIKQYMGGGFGSKQVVWKPTAIAALLSREAGRPVQLLHDREAENLAAGNRSPSHQHVRLGARRDGTLTAIDARIDVGQGAYRAGGEVAMVDGIYQTLYRCANVRTERIAYYTNTGPAVAFRAPGFVEGAFGLESAMDELARALQMDPVELRLRNYTTTEQKLQKPYTSPNALRECISRVQDALPTPRGDFKGGQSPPLTPKRRGVGFAAHNWIGGAGHPPGYAWIKLNADATADVITGTQDIGTGTRTALTQVAAEELGLPMERVRLYLGDTGVGPYAPVSSGSATQATLGPAIRAAALDLKDRILHAAAEELEVQPSDLLLRHAEIAVEGAPHKRLTLSDLTQKLGPKMLQGYGERGANPDDKAVRTFGAQAVEVEVDLDTGEVTVLRVVASHDCGRIVNPKLVDSQIIGAVTQGVGFGLLEERIVDRRFGIVLNPNLEYYELPTVADIPAIQHAPHGVPDLEANPTGAKGVGEPPLIPTAPAIANAIFDATGIRLRELPITRQRLLEALHANV